LKRVAVIGSGGAGKSALAIELGTRTGLPVIHLDRLYWGPGWTPKPEDEWAALQAELAAGDRWIMDGNYSKSLPIRLARADTVVFLDLPRLVCLWAVTRRWLRFRGRSRPDMGEGVNEALDPAFLRWIWDYPKRSRPGIVAQLAALPSTTRVVHLRSRGDAREFLAAVPSRSAAGSAAA
jgi:adenylate kinase family enzyme